MDKFKSLVFYVLRNSILPALLGILLYYWGTNTYEVAKMGVLLGSLILWDIYGELVKIRKSLTKDE